MAAAVPDGVAVADIGSGDGRLAAHLWRRGSPRVVATELKPGSLELIRDRLAGLPVEVRGGDGLMALAPGEVEVAVIAGMGGHLIARILGASPDLVRSLRLLVLQPMQHLPELRAALVASGLTEVAQSVTAYRGRPYTVLSVRPDAGR